MDYLYIDRTTGAELTETEFRRENRKRASLGEKIDAEVVLELGYDFLTVADVPNFDSNLYKAVPAARTLVEPHIYARGWDIVPLTAEETQARIEMLNAERARQIGDQITAVDANRDASLRGGVLFNGKHYHTHTDFVTELLGLIMGYQIGAYTGTTIIRTLDNTNEEFTLNDLIALAQAVGAHRKTVYAEAWAAKDALRAQL